MNKFPIFLFSILVFACSPQGKDSPILNFVLLGNDSIACYYGNSSAMKDLRYGNLTNPRFLDSILATAVNRKPAQIRLKRIGNEVQPANWEYLDTILKRNKLTYSQADTLDAKEQQFFRTPPALLSTTEPQTNELKLYQPNGEAGKDNYGPNVLKVVMLANKELYAYNNKNLKEGKRYTYKQFQLLLSSKKSEKDLFVLVKPSQQTTYESTVAMLDLLGGEKIKNYKLVDPTKEEEDFTKILLNNNSKKKTWTTLKISAKPKGTRLITLPLKKLLMRRIFRVVLNFTPLIIL